MAICVDGLSPETCMGSWNGTYCIEDVKSNQGSMPVLLVVGDQGSYIFRLWSVIPMCHNATADREPLITEHVSTRDLLFLWLLCGDRRTEDGLNNEAPRG